MGLLVMRFNKLDESEDATELSVEVADDDAADELFAAITDALEEHAPGQLGYSADYHEDADERMTG